MYEFSLIQKIAVWALPALFAITFHEVAHGWVARYRGDPTAMMLGRLSLNPIKHIDPIGTVVVPLFVAVATGWVFGWAKPVPVTQENLKNPKGDMALVAAAGPTVNLLMAFFWAVVLKLVVAAGAGTSLQFVVAMCVAGIFVNGILMLLNLIPLPPLDGGRILAGILPPRASLMLQRIEPYGLLILITLLIVGVVGRIIGPPLVFMLQELSNFANLDVKDLYMLLVQLGVSR